MQSIANKSDQTINHRAGRRGFIKLVAATGFGAIIYSELCLTSLALGPLDKKQKAGGKQEKKLPPEKEPIHDAATFRWKSFFNEFNEFALDIGMSYLGSRVSEWLAKYPRWDSVVRNFARGLNGPYNPYGDCDLIGDDRTIFFPMCNPQHAQVMLPLFDRNNLCLISEISMTTALALPVVNSQLKAEGYSQQQRAAFLIPRQCISHSYNNLALPESYRTDAGSAEFRFKGDDRDGDVHWTVWKKEHGSMQQPHRRGRVAVSFVSKNSLPPKNSQGIS